MGQWLEVLYDVLFHPKSAMIHIAGNRLSGQGLAVFLLSVFLPGAAFFLATQESAFTAVTAAAYMICSLLLWLTGTALLHLIAELYGGQGKVTSLLAALGFSQLPRLFIVPFWLTTALFSDTIRTIAMGAAVLAIIVWILVLHVKALEATYGFSSTKAILVLITPFLACGALVLMVVAFVTAHLVPWPQWG